jgi:dTDP-4-dehydrorhamnose 3,5-epimerase
VDIQETRITGLYILVDSKFQDNRGSFRRKFCSQDLENILSGRQVRQVNQSDNVTSGTVRGLHYQINESSETKIVSCIKGSALDIALDLRADSKTFLQYETLVISSENNHSFFIPEGFAHGFQTLEDNTSLIYLTTQFYSPTNERGINYLEPLIGIQWNQIATVVSLKDKEIPFLSADFKGIYQ